MAERNLIREGFVFNTRTPAGAVSGTQTLSPGEISLLADGNVTNTAFTVSGSKFIVLDADLGARWKLDRIELYTAESGSGNFEIEISDNNLDYRKVTMAGSAGLWTGTLPDSTISGAPRYIRYRHHPPVNTLVRELVAINDDNLLDFGSGGSQTSLTISDSPVGKPSDFVETLTIKNNFSKSAEAFVFVDRTFNAAEDEIEVSNSPSGPWVGRNTGLSNQPTNVPWEQGQVSNTRITPTTTALFNFSNGLANGWAMSGATQSIVDGSLRGTTATQNPLAFISSEFVTFVDSESFEAGNIRNLNKFVFPAKDADTIVVRARVQTPLQLSNILEGPRVFWKTEQNVEASAADFRTSLSVLSTAGTALTGGFQDFNFPVSSVPTWSGTIRGLAFRPFVVSTGTNIVFDINEVHAFNSQGNSVALEFNPVASGSFTTPLPFDQSTNDATTRTLLSFRHRVTQDCIITRVGMYANPTTEPGIFLARRLPGSNFPNPGTNFSVPYGISFPGTVTTTQTNLHEVKVYWQAQKGDILGAVAGVLTEGFLYTTGIAGDAFVSISGANSVSSLADFASAVNSNGFTSTNRNYLIFYEAIPTELGGYKASGTYRTPVFDLGNPLALADLDFDSSLPAGTSIDTLGQIGFNSVRARASSTPAYFGLRLGEVGPVSGTNQTLGLFLNEGSLFNSAPQNDQQINLENQIVSTDKNTFVQNLAGAIMYHKTKDELWLVDCVLSGTAPFLNTDARPTWDVYNPHNGAYIRTDHLKGNVTYGYDGTVGEGSGDTRGFLPEGMEADYDLGEIYLFQKVPAFSVGAGTYYGLVLDLEGNLKDMFLRSGSLGIASQQTTTSPGERIFSHSIGFTYAPDLKDPTVLTSGTKGVFFVLHDNEAGTNIGQRHIGRNITALRNGNDVGRRNIGLINTKVVSSIPGLGFTSGGNQTPTGLVYNRKDGLIYLHFDNLSGSYSGANKKPEFLTIRPSFNTLTFQMEYNLTSVSGTAFDTAPDVNGLSRQFKGEDTTGSISQWLPLQNRSPDFTMAITHSENRDSFVILRSYVAERSPVFPKDFPGSLNDSPVNRKNLSLMFECGAGNVTHPAVVAIPSKADALWGPVSGTLQFQDIAVEGVNFPTGRYVQVEYQLNANPQQTATPVLTNSKIAQGLRIGQIAAGGTKDIFVRTDIPEGESIGDQQGRLKVFLETEE